MSKYQYLLKIVFFLCLIASVSSFYITPLRAGTIQITDNDIRSTKLLHKEIDLQIKKEFYEAHKDIQVIASFSSLSMDDKLNFYFDYSIHCPNADCVLNFTVIRKTENVNPDFRYSFDVDYLVARGLKILQLNMTSYQEHLNLRDIENYNEHNQKENLGTFLPKNNGDAMRIMAIPNGFSNLTRTGRVVYMYTMSEDMYVVHYMQHENGHGEHDAMGWPEGKDYIKYKVLFFDASYLPQGCPTQDRWTLTQNYQSKCGTNQQTKWFFGFKSTKQRKIKGYFTQNSVGYSFHLDAEKARYGTVAFPIVNNPEFVDLRLTKFAGVGFATVLNFIQSIISLSLFTGGYSNWLYLILVLISLTIVVLLFKKRRNSSKKLKRQAFDKLEQKSETFDSVRDPNQQIENVVTAKDATIS